MDLPRIKSVIPLEDTVLAVEWEDGRRSAIQLIGWISTGGEMLAPLRNPAVWETAAVADYGATVEWAELASADAGDLAIDAFHLYQIGEDQRDFGADDLRRWQEQAGLSNNEAADFLGVSLRTWKNYRSGSPIGTATRMLLRASLRDPLLMHAHYRPRQTGRPKSAA